MSLDSLDGSEVLEFRRRWTRQGLSKKRITSGGTDVVLNSTPDQVPCKLGAHILLTGFNLSSNIPIAGAFPDSLSRGDNSGTLRPGDCILHCSTGSRLQWIGDLA